MVYSEYLIWSYLLLNVNHLCIRYLLMLASALDDIGKILVLLRDGRKLMGTLRSFDQFGIYFSFFILLHL